jgi:hypothetical protein
VSLQTTHDVQCAAAFFASWARHSESSKIVQGGFHAFGEYLARRQEQDSPFLMPLSIDALDTSLTTRYLQAGNSILLAMQAPPGLAKLGLALAQDVFAALH